MAEQNTKRHTEFGKTLYDIMKSHSVGSIKELSEILGESYANVHRLFHKTSRPRRGTVEKLAMALYLEPQEKERLLEFSPKPEPGYVITTVPRREHIIPGVPVIEPEVKRRDALTLQRDVVKELFTKQFGNMTMGDLLKVAALLNEVAERR